MHVEDVKLIWRVALNVSASRANFIVMSQQILIDGYYTVPDIARAAGCSVPAMMSRLKKDEGRFPTHAVLTSSQQRIYRGDIAIAAVADFIRTGRRPGARNKEI